MSKQNLNKSDSRRRKRIFFKEPDSGPYLKVTLVITDALEIYEQQKVSVGWLRATVSFVIECVSTVKLLLIPVYELLDKFGIVEKIMRFISF